jgi:hypothetical protein
MSGETAPMGEELSPREVVALRARLGGDFELMTFLTAHRAASAYNASGTSEVLSPDNLAGLAVVVSDYSKHIRTALVSPASAWPLAIISAAGLAATVRQYDELRNPKIGEEQHG